MKRLAVGLILFILAGAMLFGEQESPPFSFGMELNVNYNLVSGSFNLWDLRYGVGIDFLIHLGAGFYIGPEITAQFGFYKTNLNDPQFDRIAVEFPMHLTIGFFTGNIVLQAYGGFVYVGGADLSNGVVYAQDFSFVPFPEVGAKIGFGKMTFVFLECGYVIGENGYVYAGIGVRLGLF